MSAETSSDADRRGGRGRGRGRGQSPFRWTDWMDVKLRYLAKLMEMKFFSPTCGRNRAESSARRHAAALRQCRLPTWILRVQLRHNALDSIRGLTEFVLTEFSSRLCSEATGSTHSGDNRLSLAGFTRERVIATVNVKRR